jgi:uncharacterized protein
MIYLDSSAVVKLAHQETDSDALRDWLDARTETGWIGSVLVEIESLRSLARYAPAAVSRLHPVLDLIELVEFDPTVRMLARTVRPMTVRSLDAIHVATAVRLRGRLTSFVTYDKRLADAAMAAGLTTAMPTDAP